MCDLCVDYDDNGDEIPSIDPTVTERVQAGAVLLDVRMPEWFNLIDVKTLDIATPDLCVVGQLFDGDYLTGLDALDVRVAASVFGFNAVYSEYDQLNEAWRELILLRRGAPVTAR
jgi:hypothetical protein